MVLYLVDDEKNIRESIKTYIPWGDFGVTQVFTAKSGMEALDKMVLNPPDIILSDIRMPKMNGIEFATKVKELYPECIILFLSGYADKEYLKSAIQLEAFQYIEKPIDIISLQNILSDAVSKKKRILEDNLHLSKLEQSHLENLHIIRQNIINLLISLDSAELTRQTNTFRSINDYLLSQSFLIAYIKFNWPYDIDDAFLYDVRNKLLQITNSSSWMQSTLTGFNTENDLIILFDSKHSGTQITDFFNSLTIQFDFPYSYSIGLSKIKTSIQEFRQAYLEAKAAASFQFYYGTKQIIEYSHVFYTTYKLPSTLENRFTDAIKNPDKNNVLDILDQIHRDILFHKPDIVNAKSIYTALFTLLDQEARKTNNSMIDFVKNEQIIRAIDNAYLLHDIHLLLEHNITSYHDAQIGIGSCNNRIREIVQYIQKNISNSQLSIHMIAEAFQLSQAYLCSYFKKETNFTINQYITNVRIDQSKYILTNTNDKIYDIAVKVGFCDTNYFSALFKKQVGMTPLEYRKGK